MNTKAALQTVLDQVDYTEGACGLTEPVSACLPTTVIELAHQSLRNAPTNDQMDILSQIMIERKSQDLKWGIRNHDNWMWLGILMEEVGEVATAILNVWNGKEGNREIIKEIVQVAAVAIAWLECIKRNS